MRTLITCAILLTSCSLISVNNCATDDFMKVDAPTWEKCKEICTSKHRNAYGATLYSSENKEAEFRCSCGAPWACSPRLYPNQVSDAR